MFDELHGEHQSGGDGDDAGATPSRRRLVQPVGVRGVVALFGLTYLFYLAIGGFAGGLDYLTGAVSAAAVTASLASVAFRRQPTLRRTGTRLVRFGLFLPVLLWEVLKSNLYIAAVILHPRLPIDPVIGTVDTDADDGLERMVLANSITLTPGTLVVTVEEDAFVVHALTADGLAGIEGGRLDRFVSWAFDGGREP